MYVCVCCVCCQPNNFKSHKNSYIQLFIFACFPPTFPWTCMMRSTHAYTQRERTITKWLQKNRKERKSHNENKLQNRKELKKCVLKWKFFFFSTFSERILSLGCSELSFVWTYHSNTQLIRPTLMGFSLVSRNCIYRHWAEYVWTQSICCKIVFPSIDLFVMWR